MFFRTLPSLAPALLVATMVGPPPAAAETVMASNADLAEQLASLETGDQLLTGAQNRTVSFAGHDIVLEDAAAVFGYASELAYMAVIEGEASLGMLTVKRGRMLLIPPFGGEPSVERFDARRLSDAMSRQADTEGKVSFASLENLASAQDRGVFLGRLARTDFNVTTLGSAETELDRRSRVGGKAIRGVRFTPAEAGTDFEQGIVERFLAALAAGDTATVAQMLDPLPFGYTNLSGGGGEARRLMAEALIAERDWRAIAAGPPVKSGDTSWVTNGGGAQVTVNLRRTTDFAFIHSIRVGG